MYKTWWIHKRNAIMRIREIYWAIAVVSEELQSNLTRNHINNTSHEFSYYSIRPRGYCALLFWESNLQNFTKIQKSRLKTTVLRCRCHALLGVRWTTTPMLLRQIYWRTARLIYSFHFWTTPLKNLMIYLRIIEKLVLAFFACYHIIRL